MTHSWNLFNEVRIFLAHVFRITAEHRETPIRESVDLGQEKHQIATLLQGSKTHLRPFAIVLVLTGEMLVLKSVEDFTYSLGRFCEHGFQWNT